MHKKNTSRDGLGVAQFVEHLPNVHYVLGSIPACINQAWWHMPVTLTRSRLLGQRSKVLGYLVCLRVSRATLDFTF